MFLFGHVCTVVQNGLFCGQIWLVRGGLLGVRGWWSIGRVAERFTDGRVPDPGVRVLFAKEYRWQCWLDVEAALAVAEAQCGVIPAAAAQAIGSAARLKGLDVARIERGIAETSHPLMALVTELAMAAGEHGGWVHWGAPRRTSPRPVTSWSCARRTARSCGCWPGCSSRLRIWPSGPRECSAAGRTHGQHAVPITFGFKPAGWIDELVRHVARLRSAEGRVFTAMTGGAAGTFASLGPDGPRVQDAVAARLGLASMAVPSRAIADGFAEYVCLLGLLGATGTRIAGEVYELMKTELAEAARAGAAGDDRQFHHAAQAQSPVVR